MKLSRAIAAIALAATALLGTPAWARDHYVLDGASLFTPGAVQSLDQKIAAFSTQTGKEIVVVTVPSLGGKTIQQATEDEFAQQQINGVLIFMAKAEHKDALVGDRAARAFFPSGSFQSIRQAMRGYYRSGDYDTGIQTGVDLVLNQYRSHERAMGVPMRRLVPAAPTQQSFGGLGVFWIILSLIAGFLVVRAVVRAMSGPRMMPPGYGGPGGPPMGGGYGAPGYGGGGGIGGGGFLSGMLGGLGGAWLGNQLFGNHGGNMIDGNQAAGFDGNQGTTDNSGWQSDPGQADMNDGSFGHFGDSSGGGFGDSGGGGGFDGGGGGDGGGGWYEKRRRLDRAAFFVEITRRRAADDVRFARCVRRAPCVALRFHSRPARCTDSN